MTAWITIAGSTIFLERYGSGALPFTYLGSAAAGAATSVGLTKVFRRRSLVSVTMRVLAAFALFLASAFVGLLVSGAWVSIVLLVLVPILVPVGFTFLVGQAGMLLDVRELKAFYARVIAGFALGFVAGGIAAPALLELAGRTEDLLAFAAVVAGMFLWLTRLTENRFPDELSGLPGTPDEPGGPVARPTIRSLLRQRYVVYIIAFQMLSAVESQWLDYLVFDRAAQRYTSSDALAAFISRFTAIAYGTDILFLLLVAGLLLRRFGLRYGLVANSAIVLALVVAMIGCAAARGPSASIVFVLVVASRVSDLTLSDGTTRTSLSAAYQAVPPVDRLAAQATVEGLAVPVAIGASGLVLIALRETAGTGGLTLPLLTSVVLIAWIAVAIAVHRDYRTNLLSNLRHRTLDPATLTIDDANTLAAINRLVESEDERDVRLGLHTLAVAQHPDLAERLVRLAVDDRVAVRSHALDRLTELDPTAAAASARRGLAHPSPAIRAAGLRALAATGTPSDLTDLLSSWHDPHIDVRVAAAAAIARLGDDAAKARLSGDVIELSASDDPSGPLTAARVLATCPPDTGLDRSALRLLLTHRDERVLEAAIAAVRWPDDAETIHAVVAHLDTRQTATMAMEALSRGGTHVLEALDHGLSGQLGLTLPGQARFARAAAQMGDGAIAVLTRHLGHPDREVGLAVALALADISSGTNGMAGGTSAAGGAAAAIDAAIHEDLGHAAHTLRALVVLGEAPESAVLWRALEDELQLLRRRLHAFMSIRYGAEGVARVTFQLAQRDPRSHALAMEWLDVTLTGRDRAFATLVEPAWTMADRRRALSRWFPLPGSSTEEVLRDLVDDPADRWRRPWLTACALVVMANTTPPSTPMPALDRMRSSTVARDHSIVDETLAGIRRRTGLAPAPPR